MNDYTILFVIYTPFEGFLPKRMAELESRAKLDKVSQVVVTPENYITVLNGLQSDTVHLIELHPDTSVDFGTSVKYFDRLVHLKELIEKIKIHNN